ncbi:MAG TPA: hypothetical protein PLQ11_06595 [Beijerinckiaceae bacterium]|nr:hypothetical protein [Beijerinckiaceae bacterium]
MRDDDDDSDRRPYNAELAVLLQGALRARARVLALFLGLAVVTFVWFAKDAGLPLWLVLAIGVLGAVLIAFLVALVWFWLRFLSHFRGRG